MSKKKTSPPQKQSNSQMTEYFNTLPPMVQESIKQSGIKFSNEEEMKNYAKNLLSH